MNTGTASSVTLYTILKNKVMLHAPVLSWDQSIGQQGLQPGSSSADSPSVCLAGLRGTIHNSQLVRKWLINAGLQRFALNGSTRKWKCFLCSSVISMAQTGHTISFLYQCGGDSRSLHSFDVDKSLPTDSIHMTRTQRQVRRYTLCHFVNKLRKYGKQQQCQTFSLRNNVFKCHIACVQLIVTFSHHRSVYNYIKTSFSPFRPPLVTHLYTHLFTLLLFLLTVVNTYGRGRGCIVLLLKHVAIHIRCSYTHYCGDWT
jgi:hypothetical protein